MIDAFNSGEDIHRTTASQVFGLPIEMIYSDYAFKGKGC